MALLKFLKGNYANLNTAAIAEGQILICGDTGEMFVDVASDKRVKIGDFITVANLAALEALDATAVPTSRLYYVEEGNILARSNGTTWVQVNKQPTIAELKTQLGLGGLAYLGEVAEGNLNSELAAKINAASGAQHTHANKDLLDTYTQTEANLADAVAKKHSHTFNETELNKIVEGDVAKWNGVVADHLTSADKTTLENAIKEAKKAGTDANTALETYKVSNDARVLAVEEEVDGIKNGTSINNFAGVETELAKKVVKSEYEADKATFATKSEISKLAGVSEGANKVEGSSVNGQIKIDGVETVVYTHPEKHSISEVEGLQTALDGKQAAGNYSEVGHKHVKADITDFAHTHVSSEITDLDSTIKGYNYATKGELETVDKKFENYKTSEAQKAIDDEQDRRLGVIEGDYLKAADIANFETKENVKKVSDALAEYVESNNAEVAEVRGLAEAARTEEEVNGQIDAKIEALKLGETYEPIGAETRAKAYVDQEIEKANLGQYTTEQEVKDIIDAVVVGAVEGDTLTGLANLVEYINTHGGEASEMAGAIEVLEGKVEVIEGKPAYGILSTDIAAWNNEIGAKELAGSKTTTAEVKEQIEAYGYATTGYADGKASKALEDAIADAAGKYETKGTAQDIVDGLKLGETYEPIGAEGRAIAEAERQIGVLAGKVYEKSETYTKSEIEALLTWGSF